VQVDFVKSEHRFLGIGQLSEKNKKISFKMNAVTQLLIVDVSGIELKIRSGAVQKIRGFYAYL
jgi:hypothetical protein